MPKKVAYPLIALFAIPAAAFFIALKLGMFESKLPGEAEAMQEITCACEDLDCTMAQTEWFAENSMPELSQTTLSNMRPSELRRYLAADTRFSMARARNFACRDALNPPTN